MHRLFSQWRCGGEHRGRTAALKATAYETGDQLTDERNNRAFAFADHADGKGVLFAAVRVSSNAPLALRRDSFTTAGAYDRRAHAQALLTSISEFEEQQRRLHPGRNQTSHADDRPIIGRSDIFHLDKALVFDAAGERRGDWQRNLIRAAEDVIREKFTRRGIPAIFALHDEQGGNGNFHVHVTSFYRQLTPDGWARVKQRPFGKAVWRGYWADGAGILRNVQLRHLERLGVADVERPQRLSMTPARRSPAARPAKAITALKGGPNPVKGALRAIPVRDCRAASVKACWPDRSGTGQGAPVALMAPPAHVSISTAPSIRQAAAELTAPRPPAMAARASPIAPVVAAAPFLSFNAQAPPRASGASGGADDVEGIRAEFEALIEDAYRRGDMAEVYRLQARMRDRIKAARDRAKGSASRSDGGDNASRGAARPPKLPRVNGSAAPLQA